ncbi:hypothetical protein OH491_27505 (plasmid) [Termitidicoccus mucosus]
MLPKLPPPRAKARRLCSTFTLHSRRKTIAKKSRKIYEPKPATRRAGVVPAEREILIKTEHSAATPAPASANESPKELCFRIDTDNRYSAEFQLASGETISLPYHHFSFAFGSADGQTLKIKFWSHLVTITGRNRRRSKCDSMRA